MLLQPKRNSIKPCGYFETLLMLQLLNASNIINVMFVVLIIPVLFCYFSDAAYLLYPFMYVTYATFPLLPKGYSHTCRPSLQACDNVAVIWFSLNLGQFTPYLSGSLTG